MVDGEGLGWDVIGWNEMNKECQCKGCCPLRICDKRVGVALPCHHAPESKHRHPQMRSTRTSQQASLSPQSRFDPHRAHPLPPHIPFVVSSLHRSNRVEEKVQKVQAVDSCQEMHRMWREGKGEGGVSCGVWGMRKEWQQVRKVSRIQIPRPIQEGEEG